MWDPRVPRGTAAVRDLIVTSELSATEAVRGTPVAAPDVLDARGEIRQRDEVMIVANVLRSRPEYSDVGLDAGARCCVADFGLVGLLIRSSRNFSDGLTESIRFQNLCHPLPRSRQVRQGHQLIIEMDPGLLPAEMQEVVVDYQLAAIAQVWEELGAGRPARVLALNLTGPPRPHAARYGDLFGRPARFGAPRNQLVLDAMPFDEPLASAAGTAIPQLEEGCQRLLMRRHARVGVTGAVLDCLERYDGRAGLELVADDLALSARSLRRALLAEGTSFRSLEGQVGLSRAVRLLETNDLSIDQISSTLGYSATPAFTYAFKRWTGTTPAAFRRRAERLLDEGS
ncbi:AraC family transcriptional regulator [Rhodococcus koreensis]|uniref:AraC-type DNA-binding protein n=1 Tax=Rhodococcus koreensis TaxID=99653 RepID=A0A1H4IC02_9NOCA|nr:AraC family transcriptional regulator [Rhodococcus koreensis]SEB31609.1 AraC-type DNA-binding protein [Rhodococcus koreensis]